MDQAQNFVERAGVALAVLGAISLGGIFLIVLSNGSWPDFLSPIKDLFRTLGDHIGDWALIVEFWIFVLPGLVVYGLGRVARRQVR
jgi:hypothetical protein